MIVQFITWIWRSRGGLQRTGNSVQIPLSKTWLERATSERSRNGFNHSCQGSSISFSKPIMIFFHSFSLLDLSYIQIQGGLSPFNRLLFEKWRGKTNYSLTFTEKGAIYKLQQHSKVLVPIPRKWREKQLLS